MEILRDKKTLIIMVLVPILLYPAIIFGMSTVMSMIMQSQSEKTHTVWYEAQDQEFIEVFEDIYHKNQEELDFEIAFVCVSDQKLEGESGVQLDFLEEGETIQVRAEYNSAIRIPDIQKMPYRNYQSFIGNSFCHRIWKKQGFLKTFCTLYHMKQ